MADFTYWLDLLAEAEEREDWGAAARLAGRAARAADAGRQRGKLKRLMETYARWATEPALVGFEVAPQ